MEIEEKILKVLEAHTKEAFTVEALSIYIDEQVAFTASSVFVLVNKGAILHLGRGSLKNSHMFAHPNFKR